jgi:hypothetical protein
LELQNFKTSYDFPLAEANLTLHQANSSIYSWVTVEILEMVSLLESDGASPYPYFKLNT